MDWRAARMGPSGSFLPISFRRLVSLHSDSITGGAVMGRIRARGSLKRQP